MAYTKLFHSIITSSLWTEDDATRIVWITMLACADKNGEVQASVPGLARVAGVPLSACQNAIDKFLGPDPYSRTKDDDGRRIEVIPGGWALLNHGKYRRLASKEEQIQSNAERQRRHREKASRNAGVTDSNAHVTPSNASVTHARDIAEADADSNADTEAKADLNSISKINNDDGKKVHFSMPSLEEFTAYYGKAMEDVDLGEHLMLSDWLLEQHSHCTDRWETKPPVNWKSQVGRFTKFYRDYWNFTKPVEKPDNYTQDDADDGTF